jgi:hypothetical protein
MAQCDALDETGLSGRLEMNDLIIEARMFRLHCPE